MRQHTIAGGARGRDNGHLRCQRQYYSPTRVMGDPLAMDNLSHYDNNSNRLHYITDAVAAGNYSTDIDSQRAGDYAVNAFSLSYTSLTTLTGSSNQLFNCSTATSVTARWF